MVDEPTTTGRSIIMRINGNIPFHIAQAYGVAKPQTASTITSQTSTPSVTSSQPVAKIGPVSTVRTVSPAQDLSSVSGVQRPRHIDRIIGGTVHRPIAFDGAATPNAHGSLQLYTRAADKIEAAVAVNVGRAIDVRG